MTPPAGILSDLPIVTEQFDSISGSQFAGGTNPNTCTGGSACPWHGNGVASVAAAALNNRYGAAGTGGQVTDLVLLKVDGSDSSITAALFNAVARGADIINLSLGRDCGRWCRIGRSRYEAYTDALDYALDSGILVVAAAGNEALDALD